MEHHPNAGQDWLDPKPALDRLSMEGHIFLGAGLDDERQSDEATAARSRKPLVPTITTTLFPNITSPQDLTKP